MFSKYATIFLTKRTQQTDLEIQKDSSSTESITEGGKSLDELLQPNRTSTPQPTVSKGDSALNINAKTTNDNNIRFTGTDIPSTQNKNSKEHFCVQLSQNGNGSTTGPPEGRHLSLDQGNSMCHGLYEDSQSGTNPERPQPSTNRGTFEAAPCQPDKSDCINIQDKEAKRTTRATQIYLKHKETGAHPPFVLDEEEVDLLVFNFVQSIVQQTQHHMFKQLEQCMQQAYSGLLLGTPVCAKEYTKQFKKNNNTVLLTETKRLDIATNQGDWNDDEDFSSHGHPSLQPPQPSASAYSETLPKTITPSDHAFGSARRKTGFPMGSTRSTAVVSGQPAGSEDPGEYKDYFNPCIFPQQSLYTMSPVFAAAVNIHCQ